MRQAQIEVRPVSPGCPPYDTSHECPVHGSREEQCPRVLALSGREHYLRLVAGNGRVLATSETYANRASARRAVHSWVLAFCSVLDLTRGWADSLAHGAVAEYDDEGVMIL